MQLADRATCATSMATALPGSHLQALGLEEATPQPIKLVQGSLTDPGKDIRLKALESPEKFSSLFARLVVGPEAAMLNVFPDGIATYFLSVHILDGLDF